MKFDLVQIKKSVRSLSLLALAALTMTACTTGGTGGGGGYGDPYKRAWYDVYGNQCISYGHPMSGCNFYANGSKITASADPFYSSRDFYTSLWTYTDSYGYYREYYGSAWLSDSGILYDHYGNALNEVDQASAQSPDVLAQASEQEAKMAKVVGKKFADQYALAEESGVAIARTLNDWATIGRDRSRTEQDIADIGKRLYGVTLDDAKNAIVSAMQGNQQDLVELNVDVAAHWGTSPETSRTILMKWYKNEAALLGNK